MKGKVSEKLHEERSAREYAFKLLGRRDYTTSRLKTKLEKKGYSPTIISKVIEYLINTRLLDDRKLALNYAHSRLKRRPRGPVVLKHELFSKGISLEEINKIIPCVYSEFPEEELARKIVQKEIGQRKISNEIKSKIYQKLIRLGFSFDIIEKVLKHNE